jgi:hypothetical protein
MLSSRSGSRTVRSVIKATSAVSTLLSGFHASATLRAPKLFDASIGLTDDQKALQVRLLSRV